MINCPFCYSNIKPLIVAEYESVVAIKDRFPVTERHHLVLPKRHAEDYFSLTSTEKQDADHLISLLCDQIRTVDTSVTGFNLGVNCGTSAGQTIFHCHIHLIPRRDGDTPTPRGGVRGVIPDKMNY
ncbi:HIT family protein [Desulfobulbus rhabdoformis]|jgi:diadenosine tetraphosphate (Ap4A) HIT family hydrolase|uniref:HIT family protein n=1 Tax=Desulfobulbus rhabdoformis TaxID=34032 RepID=UPI001962D766|nr:HIT family protein [Desulfobulbus rhabdoformis]MBM9614835.1 HIT family protein [Desulfobulbus rhabdoformis]